MGLESDVIVYGSLGNLLTMSIYYFYISRSLISMKIPLTVAIGKTLTADRGYW